MRTVCLRTFRFCLPQRLPSQLLHSSSHQKKGEVKKNGKGNVRKRSAYISLFLFSRMLLDVYGWLQVKVADKRLVASYTTGGEDLE